MGASSSKTSAVTGLTDEQLASIRASKPAYSLEEVAQHNSEQSLWLIIEDLVFDATKFAPTHPGGAHLLLNLAGEDATDDFLDAMHSEKAMEQLNELLVGWIDKNKVTPTSTTTTTTQTSTATRLQKRKTSPNARAEPTSTDNGKTKVLILFGGRIGASKEYAEQLGHRIKISQATVEPVVLNMKDFDPEDLNTETIVLCTVATYAEGTPSDDAAFFCNWIQEAVNDWRVAEGYFDKVRFAVFGLGNSLYEEYFCAVAKKLHTGLHRMGAHPLLPVSLGDKNVSRDGHGTMQTDFDGFCAALDDLLPQCAADSTFFPDADAAPEEQFEAVPQNDISDAAQEDSSEPLLDIENLGKISDASTTTTTSDTSSSDFKDAREMVTPALKRNLQKQGYKVVGTHSGVKLCRWTKAMLRGRGGCYKHTFYGIASFQCMEMTPSLACANKCTFCWRHHTNPVGKEWRWHMNEPEMIVEGCIDQHRQMIKQMRGVPGVLPERFAEAKKIQHCALSLVGEPIMYPKIGRLLELLHEQKISSFLVTNAQFPEQMERCPVVTQLYVSVDASTPESLKAVDRPLFKDYWQRFLDSLDMLKTKQQRTVYRVTLVKGQNMDHISDYARLVARGEPTFVEIKGVTFCGAGGANELTMQNVPFHVEVRNFGEKLAAYLAEDYEVACEHEHSCSVLLCRKELKVDGKWHTWIDYPKFHQLVASGEPFTFRDYCVETPEWAVYGNEAEGFDPQEERFRKVRKGGKVNVRVIEAKQSALNEIDEDRAEWTPKQDEMKLVYADEKLKLAAVGSDW